MGNEINHTGIIERIEDNSIFVKIVQQSACAGCHAKGMCSAADRKDKIIEIPDNSGIYHLHETVMVCGKNSLGLQAVFFAFVIPLILIVILLVTGNLLEWKENINALAALLILVPYYGILSLNQKKLKKRFVFTLKKLNQ